MALIFEFSLTRFETTWGKIRKYRPNLDLATGTSLGNGRGMHRVSRRRGKGWGGGNFIESPVIHASYLSASIVLYIEKKKRDYTTSKMISG